LPEVAFRSGGLTRSGHRQHVAAAGPLAASATFLTKSGNSAYFGGRMCWHILILRF